MYTSGRTVKSSKAKPSDVAVATAQGRRLAKKHLGPGLYPMVSSKTVADLDGTRRMRTEISFAECDHSMTQALADAVQQVPGYHSMCWNAVSISYLTKLAD